MVGGAKFLRLDGVVFDDAEGLRGGLKIGYSYIAMYTSSGFISSLHGQLPY